MSVPVSEPSGTIAGRWNLAKSLMQREPSEHNIKLVTMALTGASVIDLLRIEHPDVNWERVA